MIRPMDHSIVSLSRPPDSLCSGQLRPNTTDRPSTSVFLRPSPTLSMTRQSFRGAECHLMARAGQKPKRVPFTEMDTPLILTDTETERQTDGQNDKHIDKKADRLTDSDRQTYKQPGWADRQSDRHPFVCLFVCFFVCLFGLRDGWMRMNEMRTDSDYAKKY